jgi:hypothetical protein
MSTLARLVASGRAVAPTSTGPVPLPPILGDPGIDYGCHHRADARRGALVIYLDSAAVVKLVPQEDHSADLSLGSMSNRTCHWLHLR